MFLRFIPITSWINTSFLFLWLHYIYPSTSQWRFWPSAIMPWTPLYKFLCRHVITSLGHTPSSGIAGPHMWLSMELSEKLFNCFPKQMHHLKFPPAVCEASNFSTSVLTLLSLFLIRAITVDVKLPFLLFCTLKLQSWTHAMLQEVTVLADVRASGRSVLSSASKFPCELGRYLANASLPRVTPDTLHPRFKHFINLEYLYIKTKSQTVWE